MIKFKELAEKSGAGDWGTDELTSTLRKGTPGQGITDIGLNNKERKESIDESIDDDIAHVYQRIKHFEDKIRDEKDPDFKADYKFLLQKQHDKLRELQDKKRKMSEEVKLDESKLDKSSPIYKEYEALKKKPVADLRNIIGRSHRVADLKGYDKSGAIRQILDDKYGEKKVDAFFGFSEEVELDEAQWGADNPYKKYKNDPERLRRMLRKNQDAAGNMRNRISKFMGSSPQGLKDELKDIERRITQIKDVMRESVELEEEKVIKIVANTNTRKYKEGEVIKTFPETKAGLTRAMAFQKTVKDRYSADTTMVRESVELDEGAVAVSTVEREIRKNGATQVKKSDREITFMYKGSERKIPVDRGFVKSDHYMKIQDMMENLQERPFGGDSVIKDLLPGIYNFLDRTINNKRYQFAVRMFLDLRKKNPKDARNNLIKAAKIADVDVRVLDRLFRNMVKKGVMPKHLMNYYPTFVEEADLEEGSESWEAGYKRRVVKTTKPEHKEKGYNWRIKGKDRPEISIKLYKEKPSFDEFKKQMKRVAGHEFGG